MDQFGADPELLQSFPAVGDAVQDLWTQLGRLDTAEGHQWTGVLAGWSEEAYLPEQQHSLQPVQV